MYGFKCIWDSVLVCIENRFVKRHSLDISTYWNVFIIINTYRKIQTCCLNECIHLTQTRLSRAVHILQRNSRYKINIWNIMHDVKDWPYKALRLYWCTILNVYPSQGPCALCLYFIKLHYCVDNTFSAISSLVSKII